MDEILRELKAIRALAAEGATEDFYVRLDELIEHVEGEVASRGARVIQFPPTLHPGYA